MSDLQKNLYKKTEVKEGEGSRVEPLKKSKK